YLPTVGSARATLANFFELTQHGIRLRPNASKGIEKNQTLRLIICTALAAWGASRQPLPQAWLAYGSLASVRLFRCRLRPSPIDIRYPVIDGPQPYPDTPGQSRAMDGRTTAMARKAAKKTRKAAKTTRKVAKKTRKVASKKSAAPSKAKAPWPAAQMRD